MRQDINDRKNSKNQNQMAFRNALSGGYVRLARIKSKWGLINTLLTQNTEKGPPGCSRSPGSGHRLSRVSNQADWTGSKSLYFNGLQQ
jgi:hypothetical protein